MTKMNLIQCILYGSQQLLEATRPTPTHQTSRLRVQVKYAGLNPVDAKQVIGDKLPSWTHGLIRRNILANKIPGFDFAGIALESHGGFQQGDWVFGTVEPFQGTLAQEISAPLDQIYRMPKTLSFAQASALPLVGLTAIQALEPHVKPSESNVLILGASGGTGHVALQVAKCLGARKVVGVCSTKNIDFCKSQKADVVIDYTKTEEFAAQIQQHGPYDIVLDCVTSADPRDTKRMHYPSWIQQQKDVLTENYVYRRLGGQTRDWFRAGLLRTTGVSCWNKHEQLFWIQFPQSAPYLARLCEFAEQGKLAPVVEQEFEFTAQGVQQAFDAILSRRLRGKVVVKVER